MSFMSLPTPLYPSYDELVSIDVSEYPSIQSFIKNDSEFAHLLWDWGKEFLTYIGKNKAKPTFIRFRNEIERFILWSCLIKKMPIDKFKKTQILEYIDFCMKPPKEWFSTANSDRFISSQGLYLPSEKWKPFKLRSIKGLEYDNDINETKIGSKLQDISEYKPSRESLLSIFTALSAFYKHLMDLELVYGNPSGIAKKDCKHLIKDAQVKSFDRLTENQWEKVKDTAFDLADQDDKYIRSLFIIIALKVLFLRVSELSERDDWSPIMSHFWVDKNKDTWLKIYGKGRKIRDVSVPDTFLEYLERYRNFRGMDAFPGKNDTSPLLHKFKGRGGLTSRQLTRVVQEIFDITVQRLLSSKNRIDHQEAKELSIASTHFLRHTGASIEIERGRNLKEVSVDLGHASMDTTDRTYIDPDNKRRAKSGKNRPI